MYIKSAMRSICNFLNMNSGSVCDKLYTYIILLPLRSLSKMTSFYYFQQKEVDDNVTCNTRERGVKKVEKNSDEKLNMKKVFKKRVSFSNINETYKDFFDEEDMNEKSRFILNIEDKTPFMKSKSKVELLEKIEYIEKCMYIKCKYCSREVNNSEIYCM